MPTAALIDISSRHQVYLEGLKTGETRQLLTFLKKMDKDIRLRLSGKNLTDFSRKRLDKLITLVQKDIAATMGGLNEEVIKSVEDLAEYEAGFEVRSLNQVVDVEFDLPGITQLKSAVYTNPMSIPGVSGDNLLKPFMKDLSTSAQKRVGSAIRTGYFQGETTPQILQRVRGTRAAGFTDGVIGKIGRDVDTMVKTSLQHVSSQARQQVWHNNRSVIKKVRWVSTLDSRTSQICQGLDGREFTLDRGPRPPIHPRCRSTTTPILDDRFKALDKGKTRSSRSPSGEVKPVSANKTYYGWLKDQPAPFQDSVIGINRGKLLRNGGLSAQRFQELQLGKNFQPLTLAEMKKLEPVAFGKANI